MAGKKLFGALLLFYFCWFSPFRCSATEEMSHLDRYSLLLSYSAQAENLANRLQAKLEKSDAKSEVLQATVLRLEDFVARSGELHKKELNRVAKINRRHWRQRIIWQAAAGLLSYKVIKRR